MPPTLKIENGSLTLQLGNDSANYQMIAPGFVLVQSAGEEGVVDLSTVYGPGQYSFGAHWGGTMGSGFAQIPGHIYQKVWWAGMLGVSGSLTLQQSMPSPVTLVRKFKMMGHLVGYQSNAIDPGPPIFERDIKGSGLAVIRLTSIVDNGVRLFDLKDTTYHFMPS